MEDTMKSRQEKGHAQPGTKSRQPASITGSAEAKRSAAVILEVLSGMRGPQEASEAIGISSMRYYALENRALQGMINALEPRSRGRRCAGPQDALMKSRQEADRLRRELDRTHALLRLVRKSCSIREPVAGRKSNGRPRRRQPQKRMKRLLMKLTDGKASTEATVGQAGA